MKRLINLTIFISLLFLVFISCEEKQPEIDRMAVMTKAKGIFKQLPRTMPGAEKDTPEIIALGKSLYFDVRLSKENNQSCNTCHVINNNGAGVDNLPTSPGSMVKTIGTRNSPTVLNAGFHFVQFWDGRSPNLKEQAKGPILNPVEMGMPNKKAVEMKIGAISKYKKMFKSAGMKITYDNLAEAIAAFERTLITKDRFDLFLKGNPQALRNNEIEGLLLFIDKGCTTCHTGKLLGGNMYQKMGLLKPYADTTDKGRYEVTNKETDKYMFKVPSLRNVALTAPYFHDGKVTNLKAATILMANIQLGKSLTDDEANKIVSFLESLSDINITKEQKKK